MSSASTPAQSPHRVIVVGAGGAGCLAALALAQAGVAVDLVDRGGDHPSLTAICGGLVPGADTSWQQSLGIADSIEQFVEDVMAKNKGQADAALVRTIGAACTEAIEFTGGRLGIELHLYTDIVHPGLSVPRLHATPGESGHELQESLRARAAKHPMIRRHVNTLMTHLLADGSGRVIGASGSASDGAPVRLEGHAVVIATGGFGANRDMLRQWIPSMAEAEHVGSLLSTGELIAGAMGLGAATAHMTGFQGHCHVNLGGRTHLGGSLPRLGAIMVNLNGRRFGAEDGGYSEFALEVLKQPQGIAIEIFDEVMHRQVESLGVFREAAEAGEVQRADSVAELAAHFGLDPQALADEITRYNRCVEAGVDSDWGRSILPRKLEAPFYGSRVTGALAHTQGGLKIDAHARVLAQDGQPIPGLFAIGGAAACFSGNGAEGYLSGNGLAHAFGTAWLAAEHLATQAKL